MCSIGYKSEFQVGLLLRLNTAVRSKSILNPSDAGYLVRFKSKYETL